MTSHIFKKVLHSERFRWKPWMVVRALGGSEWVIDDVKRQNGEVFLTVRTVAGGNFSLFANPNEFILADHESNVGHIMRQLRPVWGEGAIIRWDDYGEYGGAYLRIDTCETHMFEYEGDSLLEGMCYALLADPSKKSQVSAHKVVDTKI